MRGEDVLKKMQTKYLVSEKVELFRNEEIGFGVFESNKLDRGKKTQERSE